MTACAGTRTGRHAATRPASEKVCKDRSRQAPLRRRRNRRSNAFECGCAPPAVLARRECFAAWCKETPEHSAPPTNRYERWRTAKKLPARDLPPVRDRDESVAGPTG